jgi:tRNA nucleotidyltransferase/poly(A) polymerase
MSADGDAARWAAILGAVAREIDQGGGRAWLVGGCLRDALLGLPVRDVDLAVTGDPLTYAEGIRMRLGAAIAPLNRATVRLALGDGAESSGRREIDISALHGATIEDDLLLRDFRVNALALPLAAYDEFVALLDRAEQEKGATPTGGGEAGLPTPVDLIDPLRGVVDLWARRLNLASSHALLDDPGRIARAARLAASHGFAPSRELLDAARTASPLLRIVPRDRLRDEMNALLSLPRAWVGLDFLAECGALPVLLGDVSVPEASRHAIASVGATSMLQERGGLEDLESVFSGMAHLLTLDAVRSWTVVALPDGFPRIVALRWGLLLHGLSDVGMVAEGEEGEAEARAQRVLEQLPLATHMRVIARAVLTCGEWRKRLAERTLSMTELRHFFARYGDAGVDTLIGAVACDDALDGAAVVGMGSASDVAERVRRVLELYFTERERLILPPLLNGADLIRELGMRPGPAIKSALQAVREAQMDGAIVTRDEALAVAERSIHTEH